MASRSERRKMVRMEAGPRLVLFGGVVLFGVFSGIATGGQRFGSLVFAGACGLGALCALGIRKQWGASWPSDAFPGTAVTSQASRWSTLELLARIDWFQFEAVSARILDAEGWNVEIRGGANPDGGADLLASRNGRKAVVQCKHWKHVAIKPPIIRELLGTKTSAQFRADEAILFTLSDCSGAAVKCARENDVAIRDAHEIALIIERLGIRKFPELIDPETKRCPKCGAPMILRTNASSPFWGCSTYPMCRGVIERA